MALNYSHPLILPVHTTGDKLTSQLRVVDGYLFEGVPEKIVDSYSSLWHVNIGDSEELNVNRGREIDDSCSSTESTYKDIIDLLPSDPFGMDIKTTFTAITGWLEDLEVGGHVRTNNVGITQEDYDLFVGWNLIWNNAVKFQSFPSNGLFDEKSIEGYLSFPSCIQVCEMPDLSTCSFHDSEESKVVMEVHRKAEDQAKEIPLIPCDFGCQVVSTRCEIVNYETENPSSSSELHSAETVESALAFSLCNLGVKNLLSVEMVSKSLCSAIRNDPLLWMNIHIDQPLNERITNDVLEQLTSRSLGNLQCLSLVECPKITADGLSHILETNPKVTKLSVPGCTRLNIEGIMRIIKVYNSNKDVGGIKHLRIGGFYGVTHEHFEDLKLLLGVNDHEIKSYHEPHFYHRGNFYLPFDDDRAIDIEMCPKCEKFRLVYDCPAVGCQVTGETAQACRACTLCVARCAQCGRCVNGTEYEETFCLELICSDCFKQLLQYQDRLDEIVASVDLHEACDNFSLDR